MNTLRMPDSLKVTVPQRRSRTCKLQGPLRPSSLLQRGSPRPDISSWIVQVRQLGLLRSWIFCRLLSEGWKGKDSLNGTLEIQNAKLMVRTLTVYFPTICRMCWYLVSCITRVDIWGRSWLFPHGGEENAQRLKEFKSLNQETMVRKRGCRQSQAIL